MFEVDYSLKQSAYIKKNYRRNHFYTISDLSNMNLEPNLKHGGLRALHRKFKGMYRDIDKKSSIEYKASILVRHVINEYWKLVWEEMIFNFATIEITPDIMFKIKKRPFITKGRHTRIGGELYNIHVSSTMKMKKEISRHCYAYILRHGNHDLKRLVKVGYKW